MKKDDAEKAIRYLASQWQSARGLPLPPSDHHYSFGDFTRWLGEQGYSHVLDFRSTMGAQESAETWFNQEMKQTWRD